MEKAEQRSPAEFVFPITYWLQKVSEIRTTRVQPKKPLTDDLLPGRHLLTVEIADADTFVTVSWDIVIKTPP